jgi:hypothetical protein
MPICLVIEEGRDEMPLGWLFCDVAENVCQDCVYDICLDAETFGFI